MKREEAYVLWFDELKREDVELVGGKSSSLGEMTSSTNVPVPYGFATTAHAYRHFMKETGLEGRIRDEIARLTDVDNTAKPLFPHGGLYGLGHQEYRLQVVVDQQTLVAAHRCSPLFEPV